MIDDETINTLNGAMARKAAALQELGDVLGQEVTIEVPQLTKAPIKPPLRVVEVDETEVIDASANGSRFVAAIKRIFKRGG